MRPAAIPIRALATVMALSCLLAPVGCGNDSNPLGQPVCAEFTPAAAPTTGTVVARNGAGSTCDVVEIEVVATDINGVWAANWMLEYDDQVLFFLGGDTDGSHLASDGTTLISNFGSNGSAITAGVGRNGSQTSATIDFTGTQLIATLTFARIGSSGNSDLEFSGEELLDGGRPPVGIGTPGWSGGIVRIN